jgi:hypothetical protein
MSAGCTIEERQSIIDGYLELRSIKKVMVRCQRSYVFVARVLQHAGLRIAQSPEEEEAAIVQEDLRIISAWEFHDNNFQTAMRAAVEAGLENPPAMEVFKDYSPPKLGTRFYPPISRSFVGSSMASCAEQGDPKQW